MNICILISSLNRGGAERVAAALANDFYNRGNNIFVVCLDKSPPSYSLHENIQLLSVSSEGKGRITSIFKRLFSLRKNLKHINPDVILCFSMKNVLYALLTYRKKTKIIGSERTNPYYIKKNILSKFIEKILLPLADGFIFLTKEGRDYYPSAIKQKSTVIPNGLFAEDIPKSIVPFNSRKLNVISAVGRLHPVKDHITLLKAFKLFKLNHPTYKLQIYGGGSEYEKLNNLAKELKIEHSVVFNGIVDNVVQHIADSGMFILSSKSESWGNSLMEALSCGIPSISTDCDFGPRQMIKNGVNGLLVPVENKNALAEAMSKIANNHSFAKDLSKNAILIRESHSAQKVANKYYNFIEKVVVHTER